MNLSISVSCELRVHTTGIMSRFLYGLPVQHVSESVAARFLTHSLDICSGVQEGCQCEAPVTYGTVPKSSNLLINSEFVQCPCVPVYIHLRWHVTHAMLQPFFLDQLVVPKLMLH